MLKKLFLFLFCILLSSCGNNTPSTPTSTQEATPSKTETFETNYARVLRSTLSISSSGMLSQLNAWYDMFYPSGYDTSMIRIAFDIPDKTSGDLSIGADAARETYKKFSAKMSLTGSLKGINSETIIFQDVRGQLVANTETARYYGLLEAFDITGLPPSTLKDLEEIRTYIGKWWVLDYIDMVSSSMAYDASLGGDFGNFIIGYSAFIQDFVKNGTTTLLPLLEKIPIIIPTSSGSIVGNEYIYPITVSPKAIIDLTQEISLKYSGTGISENIMTEFEKFLSGVTSAGELRVSTKDPTYYSLKLSMTASGSSDMPLNIDMQSRPESFLVKATYMSGSVESIYTHKNGERSRYTLTVNNGEKTQKIIEYAGILEPGTIDMNIVFFDPNTENTTSASMQYQKNDGAFSYTMNQSKKESFLDIINISGVYGSGKITALTGTLTLPEMPKDTLSFGYNRNEDDTFSLTVKTPSGNLDGDGSLSKNDLKINLSARGFSATLEHKKNNDGSWEGKLQLPLGLIRWNGKMENEVLTDFHIKGTSPYAGLDIDLTKKDDTVTGPYIFTMKESETSSGVITIRKIPKNFDIRLDTIFEGMNTPSFFEFHNFTDLRWDKYAKVIEPENAESLTPIIQKNLEKTQKRPALQNEPSTNNDLDSIFGVSDL